ncbi:MAG: Spy/CpxP family protein refolding chaperone [Candidatus Zixiibacteriota bacterium]|nr:MAG: Spy/CpxP family protein refolding chaperone [candidate division Zixibacteria bacterium]
MGLKLMILIIAPVLVLSGTAVSIERKASSPTDSTVSPAQPEQDTVRVPAAEAMPPDKVDQPDEARSDPERFERLRMRKLLELLKLNDEQKVAFMDIARKYRDLRMESFRSHRATVDSLATGLRQEKLNEQDIERLITRLDELETSQTRLRRDFREEVKPLLTPYQYAKFVVFEHRFEARVLDRLNKFRRGGRHRGGAGNPPPPGQQIVEDDSI